MSKVNKPSLLNESRSTFLSLLIKSTLFLLHKSQPNHCDQSKSSHDLSPSLFTQSRPIQKILLRLFLGFDRPEDVPLDRLEKFKFMVLLLQVLLLLEAAVLADGLVLHEKFVGSHLTRSTLLI